MTTVSDLIGSIKSRQVDIAASLAHGHATDFSAYQRLVGRYQGLQEAMDILNDLLKEKDEDE